MRRDAHRVADLMNGRCNVANEAKADDKPPTPLPITTTSYSASVLDGAAAMIASVLEPSRKLLVLIFGEGRVEMCDRDVGRGDQHRLGVRQGIEAVFPVVVAHPGGSGAAERHGLDEQVNVHQIYAASAEGQLANEPVDDFLIAAEDEAGERTSRFRHPRHRLIEGFISQDRQNGSEDLVLHDLVVPGDGKKKRGIEIVRIAV